MKCNFLPMRLAMIKMNDNAYAQCWKRHSKMTGGNVN